ncbi:MAG TPA: hypothetical protein VMJ30_04485 [Gemmatimonadales bacterium]|nr:hypothetical protein [Gemmatimonadales bacterium]
MSVFQYRHPRIFATLLLVVVLGAGFGLGFAADRALFHYRFAKAMATGRLPREPVFPDRQRILDKMVRELELTPDQEAKVDSLLAEQNDSLHILMTRMRSDFRDLSAGTRARINGVLTSSQRAKLPRTGGRIPADEFPIGPVPGPGAPPASAPEGSAQ